MTTTWERDSRRATVTRWVARMILSLALVAMVVLAIVAFTNPGQQENLTGLLNPSKSPTATAVVLIWVVGFVAFMLPRLREGRPFALLAIGANPSSLPIVKTLPEWREHLSHDAKRRVNRAVLSLPGEGPTAPTVRDLGGRAYPILIGMDQVPEAMACAVGLAVGSPSPRRSPLDTR